MSDSEPTMDLWPPATRPPHEIRTQPPRFRGGPGSRGRCPAVLAHPPPVGLLRSSAPDHDLGPLGAKSLTATSESLIQGRLLPAAELAAQALLGRRQARGHGPLGDAQRPADLPVAESVVVAEEDGGG